MLRLSGAEPVPLFKEFIGIYNLKSLSARIRLGDKPYPVRGFMFERKLDRTGHSFTLEERPGNQVVSVDLERWSHRFFSLKGELYFPVKARAVEDVRGVLLKIENQSPFPIVLCRLYYDQRFFDMNPIPAKKSVVHRIDYETVTKERPYHLKEKGISEDDLRPAGSQNLFNPMIMALKKDLFQSVHSRYGKRKDTLQLTGWIDGSVKPITLEPSNSTTEGVTLVEWEIPIER